MYRLIVVLCDTISSKMTVKVFVSFSIKLEENYCWVCDNKYEFGQANKIGAMPDIGTNNSHELNQIEQKVKWWIELIAAMKGIAVYRLKSPFLGFMSICLYVFACKRSVSFEMISVGTKTTYGQLDALSIRQSIENLYWQSKRRGKNEINTSWN